MAFVRSSPPAQAHPLFRGVFDHWYAKAGALSALPDAPVVPDDDRRSGPARRWLRARLGRRIEGT
ncbi:hypothetical protein SGFS_103890 [Streptomyces graminofaciens]|uniref:Uncharacterized protein n=1 Tax=Streptomyces graminofaciens TaxID=68212 RepID=A0ABN5W4A8_9ACTN|nr:hypothetical protein SGFS_103890 [Streptomyces graminofaciens]